MKSILLLLIAVNLVSFALYGLDKVKAKRGLWRIRESTLLLVAALGGSLGALLGMELFRHKTKHGKFCIGIPIILAVQILLAVLIYIFIQK